MFRRRHGLPSILLATLFVLLVFFAASRSSLHLHSVRQLSPSVASSDVSSLHQQDLLSPPTFDVAFDNIVPVGIGKADIQEQDPCKSFVRPKKHKEDDRKHSGPNYKPEKDPYEGMESDGGYDVSIHAAHVGDAPLALVTGGAGFIGSHLAKRLLSLGYRVRVFDNLYSGYVRNLPLSEPAFEFMLGDIMDRNATREAVRDADYIFHLAARSEEKESRDTQRYFKSYVNENALGTWNVLDAARDEGVVRKVIYVGSSTYYGDNPLPHHENLTPKLLTPYAVSKYQGELQMQMFDRLFQVPTLIVRLFTTYGPRQPSTGAYGIPVETYVQQILNKERQITMEGDGSRFRDFVHISDTVNGLVVAAQTESLRGTTINLGTGDTKTFKDMADLVSEDQDHVDDHSQDPKGDRANTCRMKELLGWKPVADFKKSFEKLIEQVKDGNIFSEEWVTPLHALSAPHILPPHQTVLKWPKDPKDLSGIIAHADALSALAKPSKKSDQPLLSVIPFTIGNNDAKLMGDLLLHTVFSLVRYGVQHAYVIAAMDTTSLAICRSLNLPCYDATVKSYPQLIKELLEHEHDIHLAALGNTYISPVSDFMKQLNERHADHDLFQARPFGDVFIRTNSKTKKTSERWANDQGSAANAFNPFSPSDWPLDVAASNGNIDDIIRRVVYDVQTLCKGKIVGEAKQSVSVPIPVAPLSESTPEELMEKYKEEMGAQNGAQNGANHDAAGTEGSENKEPHIGGHANRPPTDDSKTNEDKENLKSPSSPISESDLTPEQKQEITKALMDMNTAKLDPQAASEVLKKLGDSTAGKDGVDDTLKLLKELAASVEAEEKPDETVKQRRSGNAGLLEEIDEEKKKPEGDGKEPIETTEEQQQGANAAASPQVETPKENEKVPEQQDDEGLQGSQYQESKQNITLPGLCAQTRFYIAPGCHPSTNSASAPSFLTSSSDPALVNAIQLKRALILAGWWQLTDCSGSTNSLSTTNTQGTFNVINSVHGGGNPGMGAMGGSGGGRINVIGGSPLENGGDSDADASVGMYNGAAGTKLDDGPFECKQSQKIPHVWVTGKPDLKLEGGICS